MKFTRGMWFVAVLAGIFLGAASGYAQTQPASITISPQDWAMNVGQTQQFTALSRTPLYFGAGSAIAAGEYHTCAVLADGTAKCWGDNSFGELGDGNKTKSSGAPVAVSGLTGAVAISAGSYHTCALLSDATAKCWGDNRYGQLGDGSKTNSLMPVAVSGLSGAVAISAGGGHTCALLSGGTVKCWGSNYSGQLGDGSKTDSLTPVAVLAGPNSSAVLSGVVAIATGHDHSCALLADGTAKCWGSNYSGQLGDGGKTDSPTPVAVTGLTGATAITTGTNHTCALLSNGTAKCWGSNYSGQLGDGSRTDSLTPVAVSGLSNAVAISAGSYHTCALLSDATAKCWGENTQYQAGDTSSAFVLTPAVVSGLSGGVAIAAGGDHSCALLSDGTAQCWGWNHDGALGDGTYVDSRVPVTVTDQNQLPGHGAITVAAGVDHTCAVLWYGAAKCWGANGFGQLGNGSATGSATPVAVLAGPATTQDLTGVVAMAGGQEHSCALLADGTAKCWGNNTWGQLGDKTFNPSQTPVSVSGLRSGAAIAAGQYHSCALKADGTVWCWGDNFDGELGHNTSTVQSWAPIEVLSGSSGSAYLSGVVAIAAGGLHSCALKADGTVWCWGYNIYGQLGVSSAQVMKSVKPVEVSSGSPGSTYLTGVTAITAGTGFTCALKADGTVWCWGYNEFHQLGNGNAIDSSTPVQATGLDGAVAIAAGQYHSCALKADGTAWCWGLNGTSPGATPVQVSGLNSAVAIAAGGQHTCVLLADGPVDCWGDNSYGQLGNGTTDGYLTTPVPTLTLTPSLVWTSSNTSVATIGTSSGLATAGPITGSTTITVTYGTLSAQTTLTVF